MENYTPKTTIVNEELGITYVYKSTTTQEEMDRQRKETFQNLLTEYERELKKGWKILWWEWGRLPSYKRRIYQINVEYFKEELNKLCQN